MSPGSILPSRATAPPKVKSIKVFTVGIQIVDGSHINYYPGLEMQS